jgi:hypothetical protein
MADDPEIDPGTLESCWFWMPALGNFLSVLPWLGFLRLSPGTTIRPDAAIALSLLMGVLFLIAGLGVGSLLIRRRKVLRGMLCVTLSLTPACLGLGAGYAISCWRSLPFAN